MQLADSHALGEQLVSLIQHWGPGIGVNWHTPNCKNEAHVSAVHGLSSSQSPSAWQHKTSSVYAQTPLLQASNVHGLASSQSDACSQHPPISALVQTPLVQVSTVHRLPSSHSAELAQHWGAGE